MPNVPPPYFPQNMSPPDPAALRKRRRIFIGCIALVVVALLSVIGVAIYLAARNWT